MSTTDRTTAKGVLIIGETTDNVPIPLVYELIGLGQRLCKVESPVSVLVLGNPASAYFNELIAGGANRVYIVSTETADLYESDVWLAAIRKVLTEVSPRLILAGHTSLGADLAPRLAFQLNAAVATGCEQIILTDGELQATRPCFGHKAREVLSLLTHPSVATVRARSNEPVIPNANHVGEVIGITMPAFETATIPCVKSRQREDKKEGPRLETADVVVAGGRGVGGPEGFAELAKLAEAMSGAVGASRVACDLGWCPHSWQIGLTGKTVTPALYIAVGISGASHHMAGCGNAGAIVAINSDPEAAIFKEARYGVIGDYKEIVPALIAEIEQVKSPEPVASAAYGTVGS